MSKPLILLAIDSREERAVLASKLREADMACEFADRRQEFVDHFQRQVPATVIMDVNFGGESAIPLFQSSASLRNGVPVVFRARRSTPELELALQASAAGADHILLAPHDDSDVALLVDRARRYHASMADKRREEETSAQADTREGELEAWLLGVSPAICEIRALILAVADTRASLLIHGESGTGKEHIAMAVHRASHRRHKSFVPVDVAVLSPGTAEEVMFGSGATLVAEGSRVTAGKCGAAEGGTLFIDELGELESKAQVRLLRFLKSGTTEPVDTARPRTLEARVIAACNRDPRHLVADGLLREDLYFRLNVVPVRVPPLRERLEDLEPLAVHFVEQFSATHGRRVKGISREALEVLRSCPWHGNVRQLRNVIERMVVFSRGPVLEANQVPEEVYGSGTMLSDSSRNRCGGRRPAVRGEGALTPLQYQERQLIIDALRRTQDNVVQAAALLHMGQATVYRKIRQYEITYNRRRRKKS